MVIALAAATTPRKAEADTLWELLHRPETMPVITSTGGTANLVPPPANNAPLLPKTTESLWELLSRADRISLNTDPSVNIIVPASTRRALGPLSGLTLPAPKRAALETDNLMGKKTFSTRSGILGNFGSWLGRMGETTGTKIKVTGYNTLSLRSESIKGNSEAFRNDQYFGRGNNGVFNDTDLTVDATFFKHFHYETRINNSLFNNPNDPNQNRVKLDYNTKKMRFEWGTLNVGFQGNSLIDFSRFTNGMQVTNRWSDQFKSQVVYSQTRAESRTIPINGNNSTGPYYVFAGQIVDGSDRVQVNGREFIKGSDYTLDSYSGELMFLKGRVILQSDVIAVTFEAVGFNTNRGTIYGSRLEYLPSKTTRLGVTYVAQNAGAGGGLTQEQQQTFYGFGSPGAAYTLNAPVDRSRPITVNVNGITLIPNTDYIIDANLTNQIRIVRTILPTELIQVRYTPLNVNPTPGNRTVLGIDGRISLGKYGSITTEAALSGLTIGGGNVNGQAYQIRADITPSKSLNTSITLRNINPTFSSIQSPGFNRNERAIEFNTDYTPSDRLRLNLNWMRAKRPSYSSGFGTSQFAVTTAGNDDYNQYTLGAAYKLTKFASLNFSRNTQGTQFIVGGKTNNTNDTLSLNYAVRNFTADISTGRNVNDSNQFFDLTGLTGGTTTGPQLYSSRSSTNSRRLSLSYQPKRWLSLNGSLSDNAITSLSSGTNTSTNARDAQIGANIELTRDIKLRYNYQLSDTGNFGNNGITTPIPGTNTGAGTGTGDTGSNIIPPSRGFIFDPHRSRDITAGGSTSGTGGGGFSNTGTNYSGGGNYANIGGFGNYSGLYGNSNNNGYGVTSFGGRSRSNMVSIDWRLKKTMQLALQLQNSISVGDYQYNSSRNGMTASFNWAPSDNMQFSLSGNLQKIAYTGGVGGNDTSAMQVSFAGKPFGGKLTTELSYQLTATRGSLSLVGNGTAATNNSTNYGSYTGRFTYPISRYNLIAEIYGTNSIGYLATTENNWRLGIEIPIVSSLRFTLGWQMFSRTNKDSEQSQYNYRVSTLLAELGLRF